MLAILRVSILRSELCFNVYSNAFQHIVHVWSLYSPSLSLPWLAITSYMSPYYFIPGCSNVRSGVFHYILHVSCLAIFRYLRCLFFATFVAFAAFTPTRHNIRYLRPWFKFVLTSIISGASHDIDADILRILSPSFALICPDTIRVSILRYLYYLCYLCCRLLPLVLPVPLSLPSLYSPWLGIISYAFTSFVRVTLSASYVLTYFATA